MSKLSKFCDTNKSSLVGESDITSDILYKILNPRNPRNRNTQDVSQAKLQGEAQVHRLHHGGGRQLCQASHGEAGQLD